MSFLVLHWYFNKMGDYVIIIIIIIIIIIVIVIVIVIVVIIIKYCVFQK
jgi:hypothetical protein